MLEQIPISIFSQITRLSAKALRLYDKKEILVPLRDQFTGYRYYIVDQIERGLKIQMLVSLGFGLEDVKHILACVEEQNFSEIERLFDIRLSRLESELHSMNKIRSIMLSNTPEEVMYLNCKEVELKQVPKIRVIAAREIGSYNVTIGKLIGELMQVIHQNEMTVTGPIMFICHDREYQEEDADIEVAIPITGRVHALDEQMEVKYLDQISAVTILYTGQYESIGQGYARVFEYIRQHKLEIAGNTREIYLNDPNTVKAEELLTEIQVPVVIS
ncbi:MAG: GyrI-like domain-containing protein [Candidatus Heimdallarchaeota archaeon]|nr:GyrI-like domain-containing protein [Candidatus Heimdallarchaeota archaeon]